MTVMPAKAGIPLRMAATAKDSGVPACAGMTAAKAGHAHRFHVMVRSSRTALLALFAAGLAALPAAADEARRLEHMLKQDCGSCHGLTMKGGLGLPLTPDALQGKPPELIASVILDGIPGTAMPPWRPLLSEDEALWMANYLKKGMTR
jgi:cytochrome c55X